MNHKIVLTNLPLTLSVALLALLSACQSGSSSRDTSHAADTASTVHVAPPASTQTDSLCYRAILNRDTTTLRLTLSGNRASGQLDINPYEKDRARGPFTGTQTGNTITVDWQRSGEGTTETYPLSLTLSGDSVAWGEGERIQQQGKWMLKQPGGTYRYALAKTACR